MKTIVLTIIISFMFAVFTLAQGQFGLGESFADTKHTRDQSAENRTQVNLQLGSQFFTGDFTGTGFGTYISPDISHQLNNSFKLRLNTTLYQGYGHGFYGYNTVEARHQTVKRDITTATVSLSGLYTVNPRLSLHGTVYKQFDLAPVDLEVHPNAFNFEYEGFTAGFNYNVTESFRISGSIDYSRGSAPYSPFYNPNRTYFNQNQYSRSPFYW